jgi:RNA polymerase-binding transcription factor DksA
MDAGTYGICERCGQPISLERLEALPWAVLCIDCKQQAGRR